MPVVLLVRHGQASFGAEDYDVLSALGREQAAAVGAELARRALRSPVAVAGSLRRQQDTASIALAAAGLHVPVVHDSRWDEYDHLGLLQRYVPEGRSEGRSEGSSERSSEGVQVLLDTALAAWVDDPSGGWADFSGGATAALTDLTGRLPAGRDAVVFTSGGVIAAVCAGLLGLDAAGVVALNRVTANGAVTKVVAGRSGATLVSFNDHAHFEGDQRRLLTYR